MVLHNPNNWHWVNRDASEWTKTYLEKTLAEISAEEGDTSARIKKLISMEGDVDVNQRKGKVTTLFDVKLDLEYEGKTGEVSDVGGSIKIPEVAHDTEEDEYVFDIDIYGDNASKQPVKDLVRSTIVPQLRKALHQLGPALIAEHGKHLQHPQGSGPSSGVSTPSTAAAAATTSALSTSASTQQSKTQSSTSSSSTRTTTTSASPSSPHHVNTTSLTSTEEFRTTAAELYQTFTDPTRLSAFTRSPPRLFEPGADGLAHEGGRFALFGGNVSGTFLELKPPTLIVQSWRLQQWPEGHHSRLEISLDQNDRESVTVMRVRWEGVPVGQEEVTRRNWGEYYVRSIKTTFGFGTVL